MARYPSSLAALCTLLLALLFSSRIHAQVVAPVAPVAEPVAPVSAPADPAPAPVNPAPAPANPAPAPADPAPVAPKPALPPPAPADPALPAPVAPAPAPPAPPAGGVGGVGVGGGAGVPILAPTQYPVVLNVPKIVTITGPDGKVVTTSTEVMFTQTFATTALETWHFATPKEGTIGLGSLKGAPAGWKPEATGK